MPDLGEGLTEAEIVRWHVKVGDTVAVDQPLLSVETAKAVVEVPAPSAGMITALHGAAGERVEIGAPLVEFDGGAPAAAATQRYGRRPMPDGGDEYAAGGGRGQRRGQPAAHPGRAGGARPGAQPRRGPRHRDRAAAPAA